MTAASNADAQPTADASTAGSERSSANAVLRHAVFFKFKDAAKPGDVEHVVKAFAALPAKIEAIKAFQWGRCINPEVKSDGLTHCFLLTFADETGRAEYLPHSEHKEFGAMLRPHLEKVFVVDYWATPQPSDARQGLKHFVFFQFKDSTQDAEVRAIEQEFAALPAQIETIKSFEWGRNNSPEKHDDGFTHAFCLTFDSQAGLSEYAAHPAHKAFAQRALPEAAQVRVIDFWAKPVDPLGTAE